MATYNFPVQYMSEPSSVPASIAVTSENYTSRYTARFADSVSGRIRLGFIPCPNFSSFSSAVARWSSQIPEGSTGNFYASFNISNLLFAPENNITGSVGQIIPAESVAGGKLYNQTISSFSGITSSNVIAVNFSRDGGNVLDSCTGTLELQSLTFNYNADTSDGRAYIWLPPNAWLVSASGGAALTKSANSFWIRTFPNSATPHMYIDFALPGDYDGEPRLIFFTTCNASAVAALFLLEYGISRPGITSDPTWSTGFVFSQSVNTTFLVYNEFTLPPVWSAGDHMHLKISRLSADAADTATQSFVFYGSYVSYIKTSLVQTIALDANAAVGTAGISRSIDSNSLKWVGTFQPLVDTYLGYADFVAPPDCGSNFAMRIRWRVRNASTGNVTFLVQASSPGLGTYRDSAPSWSGSVTTNVASSMLINESIISGISAGIIPGDDINIRLYRMGTTDSCLEAVEILQSNLEYYPI